MPSAPSSTNVATQLTDESPRKARFMDLHSRSVDVGRVAEVRQPHVFDVQVIERLIDSVEPHLMPTGAASYLVYRAIELMALQFNI